MTGAAGIPEPSGRGGRQIEPIAATNPGPAKAVQERLDTAEAKAAAKKPAEKPARAKNPKPTVSYIAVHRGWDPRDSHDRISLWNPHASQAAAEAESAHADSLGCEPRRIVRVDTAFTFVDGNGHD